jgi:hypothetical protein
MQAAGFGHDISSKIPALNPVKYFFNFFSSPAFVPVRLRSVSGRSLREPFSAKKKSAKTRVKNALPTPLATL